jgi:uncharacterized protein (DUF4415 family)
MAAEKIPPSGEGPITPPTRRVDHLEKAKKLQEQAQGRGEAKTEQPITKLTTRLPSEQVEWLKAEAKGYRERNPRRPRVTIEELIAIAIDHLRETKSLDSVIAKHRS